MYIRSTYTLGGLPRVVMLSAQLWDTLADLPKDISLNVPYRTMSILTSLPCGWCMHASTLTRLEPVRKFSISTENYMSSPVPAQNNSPELEMKAYFNKDRSWIGLTRPAPVRKGVTSPEPARNQSGIRLKCCFRTLRAIACHSHLGWAQVLAGPRGAIGSRSVRIFLPPHSHTVHL